MFIKFYQHLFSPDLTSPWWFSSSIVSTPNSWCLFPHMYFCSFLIWDLNIMFGIALDVLLQISQLVACLLVVVVWWSLMDVFFHWCLNPDQRTCAHGVVFLYCFGLWLSTSSAPWNVSLIHVLDVVVIWLPSQIDIIWHNLLHHYSKPSFDIWWMPSSICSMPSSQLNLCLEGLLYDMMASSWQ